MLMSRLSLKPLIGAGAGFIATLPMSLFLLLAQRFLPWHERYPLPPFGEITNSLADKVGLGFTKNTPPHKAVTAVSHFGYGTAAGSLYASVSPNVPVAPWLSGMLFGLGLWFAGYMGWLPALRILPPANKQPRERTIVMIVAHVVWGLFTGLLLQGLLGKRNARK